MNENEKLPPCVKKAIDKEVFLFLAIFLGLFILIGRQMGTANMFNTLMNTAYHLLMETVFYTGKELFANTHVTPLTPSTIAANSRFFESVEDVPTKALTMGMKSILSAKSILLVVSGANKHTPLTKLLNGTISTDCPITFLNLHNDVTLVCDREAYYGA